jgi:hypothetical protein
MAGPKRKSIGTSENIPVRSKRALNILERSKEESFIKVRGMERISHNHLPHCI